MEKASKKRRKFIKALILTAVSLPLLGKYLVPRQNRPKPLLKVKKADIPGNGALVFRKRQIAVIKEGKEIFALNTTCTHLGCTVNATPKGFTCPCHGSRFSHRGQILHGPADRPLKKLTIKEEKGAVLILDS